MLRIKMTSGREFYIYLTPRMSSLLHAYLERIKRLIGDKIVLTSNSVDLRILNY